jgi:hypothetical protein
MKIFKKWLDVFLISNCLCLVFFYFLTVGTLFTLMAAPLPTERVLTLALEHGGGTT